MSSTLAIINSVRKILSRHVVGNIPLRTAAAAGDDTLHIRTTERLRAGDEIIIADAIDEYAEHSLFIEEIVDTTHISLTTPLNNAWPVGSVVKRAFAGQYVKNIFPGEPDVILKYPSITVSVKSSHSEFYTTRATKERYEIEIGVFVEDSSQEEGYENLLELTDRVQKALKKNVYPLVADYTTYPITADIADQDVFIKVADSTDFGVGTLVMVEDTFKTQENIVVGPCDATTIRLQSPLKGAFSTTDTNIIIPARFIHNSWPADIKFGTIFKGTLLKGASISWFAEEIEIQFNEPWSDTQLG
jgi:hypothetical protein